MLQPGPLPNFNVSEVYVLGHLGSFASTLINGVKAIVPRGDRIEVVELGGLEAHQQHHACLANIHLTRKKEVEEHHDAWLLRLKCGHERRS